MAVKPASPDPKPVQITATTDIRDIKAPVGFPVMLWPYFVLGAVLLAALLVLLAKGLARGLKEKREGMKRRSPHEIALDRLEALKIKDMIKAGKTDDYFTELSQIVRYYIEDMFEIRAPEMTSEEFLSSLKFSRKLSFTQKSLLREFLTLCDMVKFAKYGPAESEINASFDAAVRFVLETRPDGESPDGIYAAQGPPIGGAEKPH